MSYKEFDKLHGPFWHNGKDKFECSHCGCTEYVVRMLIRFCKDCVEKGPK
jgi:hypothetical protein